MSSSLRRLHARPCLVTLRTAQAGQYHRRIAVTTTRPASTAADHTVSPHGPYDARPIGNDGKAPPPSSPPSSPLSALPLGTLLRSLLIQSASGSPLVLGPSLAVLSYLAAAQSGMLAPDRNPVLRYVLKKVLYAQFCAGETAHEVARTTEGLRAWGVQGTVLCWAKEVELRDDEKGRRELSEAEEAEHGERAIRAWAKGSMDTVMLAGKGDIVALKFSGAGPTVLRALASSSSAPPPPPPPAFLSSLRAVCDAAIRRGIRLAIDAEQIRLQSGIDAWTIDLARSYNGPGPGDAVIYNTYQAYLVSAPGTLAKHLALAADEGWCLGAKLVRGAYLASEERAKIWPDKRATDEAYDALAEGLMRRRWGGTLAPPPSAAPPAFPAVDVVLATHNMPSVRKAIALRQAQVEAGEAPVELVYAQLMGMADHVSAEAIHAGRIARGALSSSSSSSPQPPPSARARPFSSEQRSDALDRRVHRPAEAPKVYKYLVWGSVGDCMRYLVRRAEENRDAVERTAESTRALAAELRRRIRAGFFGGGAVK